MTQVISKARKPFQPSVSLRLTAFWLLLQSVHTATEGVARSKRASKTATSLRGKNSAGLSGFFPALPDGYALLDPGWWKATTPPPTTPAPKQNGTNGTANVKQAKPPGRKRFVVPSLEDLMNVKADTCTNFVDIAGTFPADQKYWKSECQSIPKKSTYIKITMGDVTEYFRPKTNSTTMCQMLTSGNLHSWSSDGKTWATPEYASAQLGGSAPNWPAKASAVDKRAELSAWGFTGTQKLSGGCCHTDRSGQGKSWGKPYKMAHCGVAKSYGPVCTPLITVTGDTVTGKAYWLKWCKKVPITASYIKVVAGVFTDYYKPLTGKTYCDMLTSNKFHKWSKDGENWKKLPPAHPVILGSAAPGSVGKERYYGPTSWGRADGHTGATGGHGYEEPFGPAVWKLTFTMSWCEVERPPPMAQLVEEMHKTEKVVESLETKLDTLHDRLLAGEKVSVDAAGNVSLAREGIYKLATKFADEEGALKQIQWMASISNTSLLSVQTELMPAARRVRSDARKLERAAQIANETATPPAMTKHEGLNKKIWKLLDPKNPDRLDVTEKKINGLQQDVDTFRGELGGEIKKIMVTKLRRSVHKLRKALKRLGATAQRRQSKTAQMGDVDGSERLGASLGLGEED